MSANIGPPALEPFRITNRKYLGSKKDLAESLLGAMIARVGLPAVFLDGFSGTGSIMAQARRLGVGRIVAVDNLYSNWTILKGFFQAPETARGLEGVLRELNDLPSHEGYISRHFGGSYFTDENCRRMDAIREGIEALRDCGRIDRDGHCYLLASFLLAADRVANTVGQYDAFLKHMGCTSRAGGRHLVDDRVYTSFALRPLQVLGPLHGEILLGDLLQKVGSIEVDTAYFDPPYNGRQYCDNYHLLENLALWQRPPVHGKTRKFAREHLKSPFSRRREVRAAFHRLIGLTRARRVFVSYNSEGLLSRGELGGLLADYGRVECLDFDYPVFGHGAGVSRKRGVKEYLFFLHKRADSR